MSDPFECHKIRIEELEAENERLWKALEDIAIYGCGMLNQPAALNAPSDVWLKKRLREYERVARCALSKQENCDGDRDD